MSQRQEGAQEQERNSLLATFGRVSCIWDQIGGVFRTNKQNRRAGEDCVLIFQVVENLDNLDNMNEELMRIGRVHAKMTRGGVTGEYYEI